MKASELMQGNIVLYEYEGQKTLARVVEIYRNSVLVEDISGEYEPIEIDEDKIFPVELIAEILEKKGWRKEFDRKPYMTFYHLEDEKYWLMWCISEHTLDVQRQNKTLLDKYNLCAERVVIACDYVHQLQQALRLCGIDKEIML